MMDITKQGNQTIVKPSQDLVAPTARGLRERLRSLVGEGIKELVVDFVDVEMIDSVGIGLLISTHNSLSQDGGKLAVTNVSEDIFGLFRALRLDHHFEVSKVAR